MRPSIPKYIRLIECLKDDIEQQNLLPNQQLPNEDELALKHNVSRGTVRKAVEELQRQGLVRKEQGRGTFINPAKPALNGFSLVELDQYIRLQNRVPGLRTIVFETIEATPAIAGQLAINEKTQVIHVAQLHLADDVPIVFEERFFDYSLCPQMTQNEVEQTSIHRLLVDKYQIPLVRLSHTIEIATLSEAKYDLFEVSEPVNVFAVDRLSFTKIDERIHPAVWYQALFRADEYRFQAQFHTSF